MPTKLENFGLIKGAAEYAKAVVATRRREGRKTPVLGLPVAREFDSAHPDAAGYVVPLPRLGRIPGVPPSVVVITDPSVSSEVLHENEFSGLTVDTMTHKAFRPTRGAFLLNRTERPVWKGERAVAIREFAPRALDSNGIDEVAASALDTLFPPAEQPPTELSPDWTKYLVAEQILTHIAGERVDPSITREAVKAHTLYTRNPLIPLAVGNSPERLRERLSQRMLGTYYDLINTVVALSERDVEQRGVLQRVLSHLPDGEHDMFDIAATLIAGLSSLRVSVDFTLNFLAQHPEYQQRAREDSGFLRSVIQESGRLMPPAPLVVRKAEKDMTLLDTTVPKGSLVMIGLFAYGGPKYVEDGETFDPTRENLDSMARDQRGQANIFSSGPRACLAKHFSPMIVQATVGGILDRFDVSTTNNPVPVLGGVSLRFNEPVEFQLQDRNTGAVINATSSYK